MRLSRLNPPIDTKRIAAFALVVLALSLLTTAITEARQGGQTSRDNNQLLRDQKNTLVLLEEDNRRLGILLDEQLQRNEEISAERNLLFGAAQRQAEEIRRLGGTPIDVFEGVDRAPNPQSTEDSTVPTPPPSQEPARQRAERPRSMASPAPERSPAASQRPSARPSPTRTPLLPGLPVVPCIAGFCPDLPEVNLVAQGVAVDAPFNFNEWDATSVARLLGLLIPLLVGVITKRYATDGVKAFVNVVASAIVGSLGYLVAANGTDYNFAGFVNAFLNTFLVSIVAYYGAWKPTGIAGTVAAKTENFGIGSPPRLQTDDKGAEEGSGR